MALRPRWKRLTHIRLTCHNRPQKTCPTHSGELTPPSKIALDLLVLFVQIGTFQRVMAEKIKKSRASFPPPPPRSVPATNGQIYPKLELTQLAGLTLPLYCRLQITRARTACGFPSSDLWTRRRCREARPVTFARALPFPAPVAAKSGPCPSPEKSGTTSTAQPTAPRARNRSKKRLAANYERSR